MEKIVTYKSTGIVLGNYWGGGQGSYEARSFNSDSLGELIELNQKALDNGSLDSGMGYESLIGALLLIEQITTITVDDEDYSNIHWSTEFIGELTETQQDFLEQCI